MKKLLLILVFLIATPAFTMPNPIGCYAVLHTPQYMAKHPNQKLSSVRLRIMKALPKDRSFGDWSFRLDVTRRGSDDILTARGKCDDFTKDGDVLRCYIYDDGGRVIFKPHGADSLLYINDTIIMGKNELQPGKDGDVIKLEQLDDWVCNVGQQAARR
jgi:hypothetical protein